MAYGDGPDDEILQSAWHDFCVQLEDAGRLVFKDVNPVIGVQRADGFRYLTQNLSQAFDLALETKDTKFPIIHPFCGPSRGLGSNNADAIYLQAWIDGESVYKITGQKGTARFWNITVQGERPEAGALHEPFGDTPRANILGDELVTEWDGSFVLYIGGERQGPNWLPTSPDSRKLFCRQYFDRWDEEAGSYRIERVGMMSPPDPATPERIVEAMRWAGRFVHDVVDYWPDYLWNTRVLCNPEAINQFDGGSYHGARSPESSWQHPTELRRGRLLTQMRWALEAGQALVVEFDHVESFWMITNEAIFGNSMDYRYRPVSYTPSRTAVDADGRIRLILTDSDPGYHNWVDTMGYRAGVLSFRNVLDPRLPELKTTLMPSADLGGFLPPATRRVTAEERTAQLLERFHANHRRFRV
jgi:hypothetical protein